MVQGGDFSEGETFISTKEDHVYVFFIKYYTLEWNKIPERFSTVFVPFYFMFSHLEMS